MRSKTLSSELTILKKDLIRFAPVGLGLCAWLGIQFTTMLESSLDYDILYEPIAFIFAPLLAIVVFGYLCDPVESNMVHSLPLRRSRLFAIHTTAACILFLVPLAVYCFLTRDLTTYSSMFRFLYTALDFLLQFSIGVLCMMLTGRKIGAALLYIFIQCLSSITYIVIEEIYLPELPGVWLDSTFLFASPSILVPGYWDLLEPNKITWLDWVIGGSIFGLTLLILGICLLLYRKRKLEHAGDLLAVTCLHPFFAFCSGMTGASAMYVFSYDRPELSVYLLGAAIGYLAYWMLAKKTARIFNLRILGGLACLLAALAGSVLLTRMDPLDRVFYVPEPENVVKATISDQTYTDKEYETSDPAVVAELEALHLQIAEHYISIGGSDLPTYEGKHIHITYELANGKTVKRDYRCKDNTLLDQVEWYLSQPIAMFGKDDPNFNIARVRYDHQYVNFDPDLTAELIELVLRECREGEMYDLTSGDSEWRIELEHAIKGGKFFVDVPVTATEVISWLEDNCTKYE